MIGANLFGGWLNVSFNVKQPIQKERINMKQFIINITGVVIPDNEWDNTSIYKVDHSTGEWCELEFDKLTSRYENLSSPIDMFKPKKVVKSWHDKEEYDEIKF